MQRRENSLKSREHDSDSTGKDDTNGKDDTKGKDNTTGKRKRHSGIFCPYMVLVIIFMATAAALYYGYEFYTNNIATTKSLELLLTDCQVVANSYKVKIHRLESEILRLPKQKPSTGTGSKWQNTRIEKDDISGENSERLNIGKYDLREALYLPDQLTESQVMEEFMKKWSQTDSRYKRCGLTRNRQLHAFAHERKICDMVIISSWAPRPCGIATHSGKLVEALKKACPKDSRIDVIAVRNPNEDYEFPEIVKATLTKEKVSDYVAASRFIEENEYGTVLFAYEFGLYQHEAVLCMLKEIKSRVITILHTLSDDLPWQYQALTQQVAMLSHQTVVMTNYMKEKAIMLHKMPSSLLSVIPHGVPDAPLTRLQSTDKQVYLPGKKIILTSGLIHQGKGIQFAIEAMPEILKRHPEAVYYVQGSPHPTGDGTQEYYEQLKKLVSEKGIENSVVFNSTFASDKDLWEMMQSAHVYVNSYVDRVASVSGTLVMAMGLGGACVSTPYPFARDALVDGAGILVPFENQVELAKAISYLLDNEERALAMGKIAFSKTTTWAQVGKMYVELAETL